MSTCCNMTFDPVVDRGGPWGRDLFTFVTSAACHMMRTLQKPRKNRPSKRQVNHRRFLHNMIQRKFAEIEAANHQLASVLFSSSRPTTESDLPTQTVQNNHQSPTTSRSQLSDHQPTEASREGALEAGRDVSCHDTTAEQQMQEMDRENEESGFQHSPKPHPEKQISRGTQATAGLSADANTLESCFQSHSPSPVSQQSNPSYEDLQPVLGAVVPDDSLGLTSMLALSDLSELSLWLSGAEDTPEEPSHHSLSPGGARELIPESLEGVMFDIVSALDTPPLSQDVCELALQGLTDPKNDPLPNYSLAHNGGPITDIRHGGLELLVSEETGEQAGGGDTGISMATTWSSTFEMGSPSEIQGDGSKSNNQSSTSVTKQLVSCRYCFDTGNGCIQNGDANFTSAIGSGNGITDSSINVPVHPGNLMGLHGNSTRPTHSHTQSNFDTNGVHLSEIYSQVHELNPAQTGGEQYSVVPDRMEEVSKESTQVVHLHCSNPFSDTEDRPPNCHSFPCKITNHNQRDNTVTEQRRILREGCWGMESRRTSDPGSDSPQSMLMQLRQGGSMLFSCLGEEALTQTDFMVENADSHMALRSNRSDEGHQTHHSITDISTSFSSPDKGYSACYDMASSGSMVPRAVSFSDCSDCFPTNGQHSCLQNDQNNSDWTGPVPHQCSTPFLGVAVSFPALRPHPCKVVTPPPEYSLLLNDIMEEEMCAF